MIINNLTDTLETSAALFGFGTIGIFIGRNENFENQPYILLNEPHEAQEIGCGKDVIEAVEMTNKKIYLQFGCKESFQVFKEAVLTFEKEYFQ